MVNELDLDFPDVNAYGETTGKVLKKYRIIGPVEDSDYDYDGIGGVTYNGGDIEVVVEAENEAEAFRKAYDQNDRLLSSLLEYDRRYGEGAYDDLCTVEEIDDELTERYTAIDFEPQPGSKLAEVTLNDDDGYWQIYTYIIPAGHSEDELVDALYEDGNMYVSAECRDFTPADITDIKKHAAEIFDKYNIYNRIFPRVDGRPATEAEAAELDRIYN